MEERVQSILSEVPISLYTHLLEKEGSGSFLQSKVWKAENRADQLGLELTAPAALVCEDLGSVEDDHDYFSCQAMARKLLQEKYGLPGAAADVYARRVASGMTGGPSVMESWGLA